ncbi:MarR family winged helix-turn-helix transcriptional regulator [Nocardioides sp. cx-169]|uniref:MarR family winged helix-turn-helix transcriptional regulator n=1 Tax=Nocardioides sp. cx-169 TaxID=2899080 RepID=UPI001E4898AD|nr:MarR family winged helix-turn-helix transcriptional regulator [Nocardioides sp. cx-169]MCD4536344.1 MarR family winged helix-turn-helix transcriptional regulator [Nocardioides sp. cx-169]
MDQPGGNVALDLFVIDQHLGALLDSALAPCGVSAAQYAVYSQLAAGARTPGDLGRALGIRSTTLSGYLSAMERAGHLVRRRHARDGRSWDLELTESGHAKVAECLPRLRASVRAVQDRLGTADDVVAVRSMLARLDRAITGVPAAADGD